jgi:hypothetical protein
LTKDVTTPPKRYAVATEPSPPVILTASRPPAPFIVSTDAAARGVVAEARRVAREEATRRVARSATGAETREDAAVMEEAICEVVVGWMEMRRGRRVDGVATRSRDDRNTRERAPGGVPIFFFRVETYSTNTLVLYGFSVWTTEKAPARVAAIRIQLATCGSRATRR